MKLYEVPQGERFLLEGVMYKLNVIDGMYSHCEDLNGKVIHLVAWAEVTLVEAYKEHPTNREAKSSLAESLQAANGSFPYFHFEPNRITVSFSEDVEAYRAHLTNREAAHRRNMEAFIQEMTAIQIESDQND
jgi:hypothetical protein